MNPKPRLGSKAKARKILIVDDHPMMREGLAQLINHESDLTVCGEAERSAEALDRITRLKPDLVIADISLPDRSGLELIKDIQSMRPGLPVLVVSMHDETLYAERVLRAGGRGYVMKQEGGKKLMEARCSPVAFLSAKKFHRRFSRPFPEISPGMPGRRLKN